MDHIYSALLWMLLTLLAVAAGVDQSRESCKQGADVPPTRSNTTMQVKQLREAMDAKGIYALIIPTADDHQNEYVGDSDKKRTFISGFMGSAGTALVTMDAQLLWTDGRYFLQAENELDCDWLLMKSGDTGVPPLTQWIIDNVASDKTVGADAKVISTRSWRLYEDVFGNKGLKMENAGDIIGGVWDDFGGRPLPSNNEVYELPMEFAGRRWQDKVADLRNKVSDSSATAVVVSALDEVAWLFNLRGSDIDYNPVFFAYTIVQTDSSKNPTLYLRESSARVNEIKSHLNTQDDGTCASAECVQIRPYDEVDTGVEMFNNADMVNDTIWVSDNTNYHITSRIQNQKRIKDNPSPLLLMKAIKNPVERDGMRKSHIRNSAVIVKFISRLEKELNEGVEWDELKVVDQIDSLRGEQVNNEGISFGTIAGSGTNGAFIHYSPANITNKVVNKDNMLLLDSGGQYLDGTTDITRTFHFGQPTDFQKLAYTLVLMGVIDLAMVKFPANITLGPARISPRRASSSVSDERAIYDGMFFSDEPGYYNITKGFGVRLETIIMAAYMDTQYGAVNTTLGFEPIAFVPFEKKLIILDMLNPMQIQWLNDYHQLCVDKTGKALSDAGEMAAHKWLVERTNPLSLVPPTTASSTENCDCNAALLPMSSMALLAVMLFSLVSY